MLSRTGGERRKEARFSVSRLRKSAILSLFVGHLPEEKSMQRRDFIKTAGVAALAAGGLSGCKEQECAEPGALPVGKPTQRYRWRMVTTWPKGFPGLGTAAERLAELVAEMSGGRLTIEVLGAGELVPAFEVFDAVARGTAQMGHGSAYYWRSKTETGQFFSTVPFGLTAQEMTSWILHGGGMELWRELYQPFGIVPMIAGNTGVQMGGWFNKEIRQIEDLQGLKMRIPGLGGEVLRRAGGVPVNLPGAELFTSLQTGVIDAAEWVGPYNDLAFGIYRAAKYYYYPGFHEPGTVVEALINRAALEALPADLQSIVLNSCKVVNQELLSEYTARNPLALETLLNEHQVELRRYPDAVLQHLRRLSAEVVADLGAKDPLSGRIYQSYQEFMAHARKWSALSELAYLNARDRIQ